MKSPITKTLACLLIGIAATPLAHAQWQAALGAESTDKSTDAPAFLPNEMWIHAGDSVTWNFGIDLPNTVTLLTPNQIRLSDFAGCPGATPNPSGFDGTQCVNSGPMFNGQSYTVIFPTPGNYKAVNLFHENDMGTIHVLDASLPLPHDQAYYDRIAAVSKRNLFIEGSIVRALGVPEARTLPGHVVVAGAGAVTATAGGVQDVSIDRFMQPQITVHQGDTVEWINADPNTPHTITFGAEPAGPPQPPSANVTTDPDGARHAIINSITDSVHSGFIRASDADRPGVTQAPLGVTRFRVTFTQAGIYPYICALHDGVGMTGTVVVVP